MTMYANTKQQRDRYAADAIMSASPMRLLTMLYDRLLLDLDRAEKAHETRAWAVASTNLLHAQDIITELTSSLKPELWDGGHQLLSLYNYVSSALIEANVKRDLAKIRESIELLEPLRQSWHEASAQLSASQPVAPRATSTGGMLGVA